MNNRIQIDMNMFLDVYKLVEALNDYEVDEYTMEVLQRLRRALNDKLEAMQKHDIYTNSKVAKTEEEKEQARQKYLNLAGIHKDWRYNSSFNEKGSV